MSSCYLSRTGLSLNIGCLSTTSEYSARNQRSAYYSETWSMSFIWPVSWHWARGLLRFPQQRRRLVLFSSEVQIKVELTLTPFGDCKLAAFVRSWSRSRSSSKAQATVPSWIDKHQGGACSSSRESGLRRLPLRQPWYELPIVTWVQLLDCNRSIRTEYIGIE